MNRERRDVPAIPGFHAVEESRKWRRETSALLSSMSDAECVEFLNRRISRFAKGKKESVQG
ncbi:MAG: hypothetical protein L3J39_14920 [Verrucomicrobiales bacterium]|nr:hypothetical protein [Verrucomicrobiales bacterium]